MSLEHIHTNGLDIRELERDAQTASMLGSLFPIDPQTLLKLIDLLHQADSDLADKQYAIDNYECANCEDLSWQVQTLTDTVQTVKRVLDGHETA